ncbi:MAG: 50S ribosomal protein L24 [Trueperaceae bacterium]|nr:50S ribosomal protein L24 [Trueperaceae bacterium]MCO5174184.1 50S ribosomal protein L24 [Trueperaceae bacterium]MCW5820058.1 50S ribosomal protein L24 [Trueperaceae bacterium]
MSRVKTRIKKGDNVKVIAGKHKGSSGEVISVDREAGRVLVKNVNIIRKAQRPTQENPRGGFVEQEASLHLSNVQLLDPKTGTPTRIAYRLQDDGTKVRVAVKSGAQLDE